jgi:hypothetical protein
MLEHTLKESTPERAAKGVFFSETTQLKIRPFSRWPVGFLFCGLAFLLCMLLTVTPLVRLPDTVIHLQILPGAWLAQVGSWLPPDLGLSSQLLDDRGSTAYVEFFCLILLAFAFYLLGARLTRQYTTAREQRVIRGIIWSGSILTGVIYVVTPAMLSHDILAYASYGRILIAYHTNPYFSPIANFPRDPFVPLNYWASVVSAYGPIWMLVCGGMSLFLGASPLGYVLAFRIFALVLQLLTTWLVGRTLRTMGRSPRTVTLGMLLYAWNPLFILESSLGGHNDVLMVTFVLSGILLAARAETRGTLLRTSGYLPPVVALSLAVLVKFTALPILAAYLIFLICKNLQASSDLQNTKRDWRPTEQMLGWSGLVVSVVMLAFYGPFWLGHSWQGIIASFQEQPSSLYAENSLMRATTDFLLSHAADRQNGFMLILSNRHYWDSLNYLVIAIFLYIGARWLWKQPTVRNFVLLALATLGMVMLITPWFFSWYIIWILCLAVVCLPTRAGRIESALLVFTLTISLTSLLIYLFKDDYQPFGLWLYTGSALVTIPPACTFLLTLLLWRPERSPAKAKAE